MLSALPPHRDRETRLRSAILALAIAVASVACQQQAEPTPSVLRWGVTPTPTIRHVETDIVTPELTPLAPEAILAPSPGLTSPALSHAVELSGAAPILHPEDWLAAAGWPPELWAQAAAVAWCESRWHPDSVSSGGHLGLFQIAPDPWAAYAGVTPESLLDPVVNAKVALAIVRYEQSRPEPMWSNWTCKPY